ncbi:MAG: YihY family inner membrane protein [Planctomycetes bacterium]|nr:YihY family inner membrane protein [Planctomycetota bacterium]
MLKHIRAVLDALFHQESASRFPRWLVPPFRFGYLIIQEFSRNRCPEKASALGFQTVFSLIPAFALAMFFFHVFGNFSGLGQKVEQRLIHVFSIDSIILKVSAPQAANTQDTAAPDSDAANAPTTTVALNEKVQELVNDVNSKLETGGLSIVSFAWLIVAALTLAMTMEKSLNDIWGSVGKRRLLRRIAVYWSVLTLGPLCFGLSIYVTDKGRMNSFFPDLALSLFGPFIALYLIYQLMPAASVRAACAGAGAFVSAILWVLNKFLFGLYVEHAVSYDKLYGTLGLFPLFLFWVWLVWIIVLIGAEVGYTLQNLVRLAAEERRRRGAPFIQPGLVALGLVLHAGRAFMSGKGAVSDAELARSTGLPDHLWHRLVNLLIDRRILVEAGSDGSGFSPARPLESLTVEEVFAAVEDSLVARPDESWHPEQEQLQGLANLLVRARQRELGNTSIADLLAENTAAPVGSAAKSNNRD